MPPRLTPQLTPFSPVWAPAPRTGLRQFGTVLRRGVTLGLLGVWAMGGGLARAAAPTGGTAPTTPCTAAPTAPSLQEVLPGIAVAHGQWVSRDPQGPVRSATTVVLGQGLGQGITLLDPGPSRAWGRQLQQQLNCPRAQRVMELINSHAHAEHVLANSAWAVPVWASANTQASMRQRCPDCLAALRRDLGAPALHGTRIVLPTRRLQEGQGLHAGGREWVVLDMRSAHTESDLVLWSAAEGIALVGPLVDGTGLVLAQGSVQGWLQALQRIEALQPQWLIGQHLVAGPGQAHSALSAQRQALCTLVQQAWQGLDKGWSENEALQQPTQGDARTRRQQRFNLLRVWREMEGLWMARQPMPAACSAPDVGR